MQTAIAAALGIAFLLSGLGVLAQSGFTSINVLTEAWDSMEERSSEIADTRIEVLSSSHSAPNVDVTLKNSGLFSLGNFDEWDVLVQYYEAGGTYHADRLTYTTAAAPAGDQWTVTGIYSDASALTTEAFQPNIFNPDEEMIIRLNLSPSARSSPENQAAIATPNGVTVSTLF